MSDLDLKYNREVVCPYCKKEQSDSWELGDDDGEYECGFCSKTFLYERHIDVTYSSTPVDCLNDESLHNWEKSVGAPIEYFAKRQRCSNCYRERVLK